MNRAQKNIAKLIANRDDISIKEAEELVEETIEEIEECLSEDEDAYDEIEDIIANNLGLEPDYIINLLNL